MKPLHRTTPSRYRIRKGTYHQRARGIRAVSKKQAKELALRIALRKELLEECDNTCMTCGNIRRDLRGLSLSHIIALSRGGKTTRENCLIECYPCHEEYEKHPERRSNGEATGFRQG